MATPSPFFARITPAGYEQYPDLMIVLPLEGFLPGSAPPRPHPEPPPPGGWPHPSHPIMLPGMPGWGQGPGTPGWDPRPEHPIVLPDPLPPQLPGIIVPPPGQPGSITQPFPPGEVPPHAAQGLSKFFVVLPGVGVVGPYTSGPTGAPVRK